MEIPRQDGVWPLLNTARGLDSGARHVLDWIEHMKAGKVAPTGEGDKLSATEFFLNHAAMLNSMAMGTAVRAEQDATEGGERAECKTLHARNRRTLSDIINARPFQPVGP